MQGLGRLKKSPPTISILGLALPISDSQPLCIPHHSIHLRFGLPTRLLPSGLSKVIFLHGRLSCIHTICPAHLNLDILIVVTKSVSSYRRYSSSLYLAAHPTPKLEDHPLLAVRDYLFNIFAATLHIGVRSSIRNPMERHAVVLRTRLSRNCVSKQ